MIRRDFSVFGILQDLFVGLQLSFLGPIAPLIQLAILYDALIYKKVGYRLDWRAFPLLKDAKEFRDSAKAIGILKVLPLFLILSIAPAFFATPSIWVLVGIPLWFLPKDSLVLIWEKELFYRPFRKTQGNFSSFAQNEIIRPTEVYHAYSKKYPLYRHTKGFQGEKVATINAEGKPHVIFLFFESLRAKDLYRLPNLSALSKECYTFPNFYSNSVLTFRTFFTSLYGLPYELGISGGLDRELDVYGLPDILKREGYERNFFTGATWSLNGIGPFLSKYGGDRVFDRKRLLEHYGKVDQSSWGVADEYLLDFAASHLEQHKDIPQFYSLLTISSHHPWNVPKSYLGPTFEEEEGEYTPKYLQTLHYTDHCIGTFIKQLKKRNLSKDVLLFITGDHGFYLGAGDRGFEYQRGTHSDNFHVPLMIYGEGRIQNPQEILTWGSHADLYPTFLDLFNLEGMQHSIGKSLLRKDESPPIFYHNPSHYNGGLCSKNASKETEKSFQEMMQYMFQEGALSPDKEERGRLRLDPFEPSLKLDKNSLLKEIEEKSPMVTLNLNCHQELDDTLLKSVSKWNPDLHHLSINQSYRVTDQGVKEVLSSCPSLVSLDLSYCPLITANCLESLPESFYELNLAGTDVVFNRSIKDLEILNLEKTPISMSALSNLPFLCPHLLTLSISYPMFNGSVIRKAIDPLPLYRLSINECDQMSNEEAEKLFTPHPHLRFLFLERCHQITDALFQGMKDISLRHLTLQGAHCLTDEGLIALLELPLDSLEIQGCPNLTDRGISAVERHQSKFSKLKIG